MHNADTKPKIACDKRFGGPNTRDLNLQSVRNVHTDPKNSDSKTNHRVWDTNVICLWISLRIIYYGPPQAPKNNILKVHAELVFRACGAFYRKKTKISYVNQTILRNRRKPQIILRSERIPHPRGLRHEPQITRFLKIISPMSKDKFPEL